DPLRRRETARRDRACGDRAAASAAGRRADRQRRSFAGAPSAAAADRTEQVRHLGRHRDTRYRPDGSLRRAAARSARRQPASLRMSIAMAAQSEYDEEEPAPVRAAAEDVLMRAEASIVPEDSISGRALLAVIAIMTFLAALTLGAVVLVRTAAGEWQSAVAREVTVQVRPSADRNIEADVQRAAALASATTGVAGVRAYSKEESGRLLEPWLGSGLALDELPVPRMIVVRIAPGETPDLAGLRTQLAAQIPGASLDDHRAFI